ncbi:hypothetical protein KM043_005027 [Ampulex compressa]|nr:hypothetical protein KM043_005027 [Ampulex compressa]
MIDVIRAVVHPAGKPSFHPSRGSPVSLSVITRSATGIEKSKDDRRNSSTSPSIRKSEFLLAAVGSSVSYSAFEVMQIHVARSRESVRARRALSLADTAEAPLGKLLAEQRSIRERGATSLARPRNANVIQSPLHLLLVSTESDRSDASDLASRYAISRRCFCLAEIHACREKGASGP